MSCRCGCPATRSRRALHAAWRRREIAWRTALRLGLIAAALSALGAVYPALAQTKLEEITVTAQRFAQNIQDVPIAVSAVTAERIREQAITELAQVGGLMPNVEFQNNSSFARSTSVLTAPRGSSRGGVGPCALSAPVSTAPDFEQENARSYELGWKSEFFDRRMLLNAAAFMTEYEGIQLNFQQGLSPTIENAGDADIKGLQSGLRGSLSQGLSIAAAVGYLDAEYTQLEPGVARYYARERNAAIAGVDHQPQSTVHALPR